MGVGALRDAVVMVSDEDGVAGGMDGDREAGPRSFVPSALVQHAAILLATARMLCAREQDAQDLVQATYELALRHSSSLREPDRLLPWLLRIETREAYRLRRRLRYSEFAPHGELVDESTPSEHFFSLRQALASLPRRERAAIVLHHMVGLSVADTADAMGTSANTVKSQLKSGLVRLREAMR